MECGQSDVAVQDWVWIWGPTEDSHFRAHSFGSDVCTQCLEVYRGTGSGPAHAAVQRGQVLLGDRVLVVGAAQRLVSSGWVTVPALQQARSSRGHIARCCVKPQWHRTHSENTGKEASSPSLKGQWSLCYSVWTEPWKNSRVCQTPARSNGGDSRWWGQSLWVLLGIRERVNTRKVSQSVSQRASLCLERWGCRD